MKGAIDILKNDDISFKVILFERGESPSDSNANYIYLHPYLSIWIRAKLGITTSAQLKKKKFPLVKKLAHLPHSIVSLHMIYPEKAFNDFDYIFCTGHHHIEETKDINRLYGCSIDGLESGYLKLDTLHQIAKTKPEVKRDKRVILLAPSWGEENILDSIGELLIDTLVAEGYVLIIRPHPIFFTEKKEIIRMLRNKCDNINIFLENPTDSNTSFFEADVMISDYSGVAFEFAFLREKPVLFINVAKKVLNIHYKKINLEPIEISMRNKIGMVVEPEINLISDGLESIIDNSKSYQKDIVMARDELLFNYLGASNVIANQIKKLIKE